MDQIKVGKFIAQKRKEQGWTQLQLAEKLGITDRAVSKWETGKSLPDASLMLELCTYLKITVNDLLSGEAVSMEQYQEKTESNLVELARQKEAADKRLLFFEIVLGVTSAVFLLAMLVIAAVMMTFQENLWVFLLLVGIGLGQFIVVALFALRIEQAAGYYQCRKCGHCYVPAYRSVSLAMHLGRTRYMKCPRCGQRSWQKKVLRPEETTE